MNLSSRTDSELVKLAQGGSRKAFDELDARHRNNVYAQCFGMMREAEAARDCAQESFASAYQALPRFRQDARFSTWLFAIARNACLMSLRKRKLVTVSLDRPVELSGGTVEWEVADASADSSAAVMREELKTILTHQVENLNPTSRIVFELRLVQGLSTRCTGLALGLSDSAVKSRLHRARMSLRDGLTPYVHSGHVDL